MTSPATEISKSENRALRPFFLRDGAGTRIYGVLLRNLYLLKGSIPRLIDLFYWPTLNMLIWGFFNYYLTKQITGIGLVAGTFLGAAMMWDIFVRSQLNVMRPFMEELWSRNLGAVFVSPISPFEYAIGLVALSIITTIIAMGVCVIAAELIFGFWLPGLGWGLAGFVFNLAMAGWWGGFLLIAMLLRFGSASEWLAWMLSFVFAPLVGVYYPISVLPSWLQPISNLLPPTYVFEGLRELLNHHSVHYDLMLYAFLLNLVFLGFSGFVFLRTFENTRRRSGLLQVAE